MVSLAPPYYKIEGVSILKDHEDELQYYYLPLLPHLTVKEDNGVEVPQIQLIKYRGDAGNGGFLNFDVNLGVTQERLEIIRSELKSINGLDQAPRIAPVPILDGTVKLMILGKESGDDTTSTDSNPQFIVKLSHSSKPSLYGTNQASFSVELDQSGVEVLEEALQGELTPIGIVYSLDYLALRPAYSVRVTAEWDRVQKHLEKSFGGKFLFFSAQVDKVVDELVEDRLIKLEVNNYIPPGEDAADLIGRLDQAVNEVKDMVLETFFEPSLDPIPVKEEKRDGWDKAGDFLGRMHLASVTGGASELPAPSFSYKKVDYTRIDKKRLSVDMTESTTVKRSIYPQAHLQGLFSILRDNDINLDRFVKSVDLGSDWFNKRKVNVISRADFETDQIESINVILEYGGEAQNVLLEAQNLTENVSWNSVIENDRMTRPVKTKYQVNFKDARSAERPISLNSEEEIIEYEQLEIRPHELYSILPIAIVPIDFPWTAYPKIEVHVRYADIENSIDIQDVFLLDETRKETTWKLFTLDPEKKTYEYKIIYRAVDHRDIETPWQERESEDIPLRDPFPKKRRLQVVPALPWTGVSYVFVDVTYIDEENGFREDHSVEFTSTNKAYKTVEITRFENPENRFITFKSTIIYEDGRVIELPTSTTVDNRVIITPKMKGHKIITIQAPTQPFNDVGINQVEVTLRSNDEDVGLQFIDNFVFKTHNARKKYFEFDYADEQKANYEYKIAYAYSNGMLRETDWQSSKNALLEIELE